MPGERPRARGDFGSVSVAIREEVEELLQRMLGFAAWALDRIDPVKRMLDVVPVASLGGALTWRTRAEHERSPNSFPIRMSNEPAVVSLTPPRRHRSALGQDTAAIAQDLVVLLGRSLRP